MPSGPSAARFFTVRDIDINRAALGAADGRRAKEAKEDRKLVQSPAYDSHPVSGLLFL